MHTYIKQGGKVCQASLKKSNLTIHCALSAWIVICRLKWKCLYQIKDLPCFVQYEVHNGVHQLFKVFLQALRFLHISCCTPRLNHWLPPEHTRVKVQNTLRKMIW